MASLVSEKLIVLFVCTHNSSRSQMAEGLLRAFCRDSCEVYSAGTAPSGVSPFAVEVMHEIGIDMGDHTSDHVGGYASLPPDYVVTVCDSAREACPFVPARVRFIHHRFADPRAVEGTDQEKLAAFRQVRDQIQVWLRNEFIPAM